MFGMGQTYMHAMRMRECVEHKSRVQTVVMATKWPKVQYMYTIMIARINFMNL